MTERLGLPVFVDNDGNAAAIAEHRAGAARGASEAVILTLGTGIGGGLILRGLPYRGAIGAGADGALVKDERYTDLATGQRALTTIRPLHTGTYFGLPGRIIMMLVSLALPGFAITGWLLYLGRRRQKRER